MASNLFESVSEAVLALEGNVIEDLHLPLPSDLRDIAKANTLISGIVEERIPELLNQVRKQTWDEDGEYHAYEFRRRTIGFPDIQLVRRSNPEECIFELEAKSWYVLATECLTARFGTSVQAMKGETLIAVVAWVLDGIVSGRPKFLQIHVDDARRLAAIRDEEWTSIGPEGSHRVTQPENPYGTPLNLWRTQAVAQSRDSTGQWQGDDNFGKLDRLHDPAIRKFRDGALSHTMAGKTLGEWRGFMMNCSDPKKPVKDWREDQQALFPS